MKRIPSYAQAFFAIAVAWVLVLNLGASPFVPLEWQGRVKSGSLVDQRKHVGWDLDVNGNFIDDELEQMPPGMPAKVIVQLSECMHPAEAEAWFAQYGPVIETGILVAYVVVEDVVLEEMEDMVRDPRVAAVEMIREEQRLLDTSTRVIRARTSVGQDFADLFPNVTGKNVSIAVVDTGVDDAQHTAFAGKYKGGYNAVTKSATNPDDDNHEAMILAGPNGICNTSAKGDDVQELPLNQSRPNMTCIASGPNGTIDSTPGGDDFLGAINWGGVCSSAGVIGIGPNGVCNTTAAGDDYQIIPFGQRYPDAVCITPGANGVLDTTNLGGDDRLSVTFHGTHVAGIALGKGVGTGCRPANDGSTPNNCGGVAPGAGLVDVKVLRSDGFTETDIVLRGLEWIWKNKKADVVNLSLGNPTPSHGQTASAKMLNALVSNGIHVVVAAGNSGGPCLGPWASATMPITVANADDRGTVNRNDDRFEWLSTFGPREDYAGATILDPGMFKPELAAPGTNIFSTRGTAGTGSTSTHHALSGTSMSAPHVAGAIALLLEMKAPDDVPPGSMKHLLLYTAFHPPQHQAAFPNDDPVYDIHWGYGLLDVYAAGNALKTGVADMAFPACTAAHPDYPTVRRCQLGVGTPSYANATDIQLTTNPPIQGQPNTIRVHYINNGPGQAEDVRICVAVKDMAVGPLEFYHVGCCQFPAPLGSGATGFVSFPWTPAKSSHQCIQASIDYGLDTDFTNNLTQRNVNPIKSSSPAEAEFRVENPLSEPATIVLQVNRDPATARRFGVELERETFNLDPADCPVLNSISFFPSGSLPVGTVGTFDVAATAYSESHPDGIELSGIVFEVTIVDPGLERAYSCAAHAREGEICLPIALASREATTDPRPGVDKIEAVFNVPVKPRPGFSNEQAVLIEALHGAAIPPFRAEFGGFAPNGNELTIQFLQPLVNGDIYRFSFAPGLVDLDGENLSGDSDFDIHVLEGDADNSGDLTAADIVFVRGLIREPVMFGDTTRADVNRDGVIDDADVRLVAAFVGAPEIVALTRERGGLSLRWIGPADHRFIVERAPVASGQWRQIGTVVSSGPETSFLDTGVPLDGGSSMYRVGNAGPIPLPEAVGEVWPMAVIPDADSVGVESALEIWDCRPVRAVEVTVDITHTWRGDLVVTLIPPAGPAVLLQDRQGGGEDDIHFTYTLDNTPGLGILRGEPACGPWILKVADLAARDVGTFEHWLLRVIMEP